MKLKIALLLGAGFSHPAGMPIMRDLAMNFPAHLPTEEKLIYRRLYQLLPEIADDFELLMQICQDLKDTPVDLINRLAMCCFGQEVIDLNQLTVGAATLDYYLKNYLRQNCQIKKERLEYLYPFGEWLKKTGKGIDIFTVNYDLVIESLCKEFLLQYTDGFQVDWQPELFHDSQFQIKLYKLHGSFNWYQSKLGERVKIPVLDYGENLVDGQLNSMMVYPKREKRELFEELLRLFREKLLTLDRLIIIGYSFRDQELKELIVDGMKKNQQLALEVVSPSSKAIAKEFEQSNRVECFTAGVEEWVKSRWEKK